MENRDFVFELRLGDGSPDGFIKLVEQAVAAQPSVLIAGATLEAVALNRATSSIPIVCPALASTTESEKCLIQKIAGEVL